MHTKHIIRVIILRKGIWHICMDLKCNERLFMTPARVATYAMWQVFH